LFAIFIFWFFGRNLDWQKIIQSLQKANFLYLLAGCLAISLGYFQRAIRWKVLLAPITESSLRELFATTTVGFTAVFLVGRMGEIVRPMWIPMRDKRVRPSAAFVTLGVERIFDLVALTCLFASSLLLLNAPAGREKEFANFKTIGIFMLFGVIVGFAGLYIYQKYATGIIGWIEKILNKTFIPNKIRNIFISLLKQVAASLQVLRDWREILSVSFWTASLWIGITFSTWFTILAFGLPFTFSDAVFVMGFAAVSSIVPTPGGAAGAFHAATAGALIFLNVSTEEAAATSIAMHLVYFAPAIVFGLYYFFHGDISIERFKNLLSSEPVVEESESKVQIPKPEAEPKSSI
jgi:uncharacterized protein (TIRG00374 family)